MYKTTNNSCFSGSIPGENIAQLPIGIYTIEYQGAANIPFLKPATEFKTKELHGESNKIVNLVQRYVANSDENLGFLFTGQSGMGKTQTIRNLINLLDYPCIVIDHEVGSGTLTELINDAGTPVIVFFDEFEKIFTDKSEHLLGFFDGITENRVISFCSMNETGRLSSYFFNRPGRFIFNFRFEELPVSVALEYIRSKIEVEDEERLTNYLGTVYNLSYDLCDKIVLLNNRLGSSNLADSLQYLNQDIAIFEKSAILKIVTSTGTILLESETYDLNRKVPKLDFNYERKVGKKNIDFCLDATESSFVRGRVTQFDDAEVRRRLNIPPEEDVQYSITMSYEKKSRSYKSQLVF